MSISKSWNFGAITNSIGGVYSSLGFSKRRDKVKDLVDSYSNKNTMTEEEFSNMLSGETQKRKWWQFWIRK